METHDIAFWLNQVLTQYQIEKGGSYSVASNFNHLGKSGDVKMDIQADGKRFEVIIRQK